MAYQDESGGARQKPATPETYIPDQWQIRILTGLVLLVGVVLFLDLMGGAR